MTDQQLLDRITLDPKVMTGKPVIKGTRLTVDYILNLLAHGATERKIMGEYDGLVREDIQDFGEKVHRERRPHKGVVLLRLEDERASSKIGTI